MYRAVMAYKDYRNDDCLGIKLSPEFESRDDAEIYAVLFLYHKVWLIYMNKEDKIQFQKFLSNGKMEEAKDILADIKDLHPEVIADARYEIISLN